MVHVAREMQRQDFHLPLMIGGATTSKAHTAVKIEPKYANDAVIYVTDASRAVGVATQLLSKELKGAFVDKTRQEYVEVRERTANRSARTERLSYDQAIAAKPHYDWAAYQPAVPSFTGVKVLEDIDLRELAEYIDWTPFFISWDLAGKFPRILTDEVVGEAATALYEAATALYQDARDMLEKLISEQLISARAVFGFWPANQVEHDDIEVYGDQGQTLATLHHLRQQTIKPDGKPNWSLADFVAPKDSGVTDYVGGFITTAGIGAEEVAKAYQDKGDDYSSIMVKALADRLAEACAEWLHARVRKQYWGYAQDEQLDNEALIKEQYSGIRPAPGYPACPDHTEKATLFRLLDGTAIGETGPSGVFLTEHFAMFPAAAVRPPSAAGISPTRRRSTSRSARWKRTRSSATALAKARTSASANAGWHRTWATRPDPVGAAVSGSPFTACRLPLAPLAACRFQSPKFLPRRLVHPSQQVPHLP